MNILHSTSFFTLFSTFYNSSLAQIYIYNKPKILHSTIFLGTSSTFYKSNFGQFYILQIDYDPPPFYEQISKETLASCFLTHSIVYWLIYIGVSSWWKNGSQDLLKLFPLITFHVILKL